MDTTLTTITGLAEGVAPTAAADQIRPRATRKSGTVKGRAYVSFIAEFRSARVKARRQAARTGCAVYVYALPDGVYWISQVGPDDVAKWTGDLKFVETVEAVV